MRRGVRLGLVFGVALAGLPFLPLYIERTMVRAQHTGLVDDVITMGYAVRTLYGFWDDFGYMRREQHAPLFLALNVGLLLVYAGLVAFGVDRFFFRRRRA